MTPAPPGRRCWGESDEGYTIEIDPTLRARVEAVCAAAGLDARGARLLKFTNNAVFELPNDRAVVRIAGSRAMHRRTEKVVTVARWLAGHDFPAVRLMPAVAQPVAAGDDLATVWEAVPAVSAPPTVGDIGVLLSRFHALPQAAALPRFDPVEDVRWRLDHAAGVAGIPANNGEHSAVLTADDLAFLRARCDAVEDQLADVDWILPPGPIHGDAQRGNLIPGPAGPVMCDFDSTCIGPREWDLIPILFGVQRLADPPDNAANLAAAYGVDLTSWAGFDVLMRVRELKLVTSVVPVLSVNPKVRREFRRRLHSLRTGDRSTTWQRYT